MESLVIPSFSGGVVLAAQAEALQTDELQQADGADLGPRGQLISSAIESFYTLLDAFGGAGPMRPIYGIYLGAWAQEVQCIVAGQQPTSGKILARFDPATEGPVVPIGKIDYTFGLELPRAHGHIATFASFPYVKGGVQIRPLLLNLSARVPETPGIVGEVGCFVFYYTAGVWAWRGLSLYDPLGTGINGEFPGGVSSKRLMFRVIAAYNNHIFGAGHDESEAARDGPNRLMFSNLGNPLKWGNDNLAAPGVDRAFSDTDAINVGGAGEVITALLASGGRLWIGTNRGTHYLQGYGRDSFVTDGTTGIPKSLDVIGPNALCEGPDGHLYGCSSRGLWGYIDGGVRHLYEKLRDPNGHSIGYWDLIWHDPARAVLGYPGQTNADFVWLLAVPELNQLWIVIPFCSAATGAGYGVDTVILKYHTETGGFTRQVFLAKSFTHGVAIKRSAVSPDTILFVNSPELSSVENVFRYRYRATPVTSPASSAMTVMTGEYAPHGPNGVGVCRVCYLTLAWETAAAVSTFSIVPYVDGQALAAIALTIGVAAPVGPANGDLWLDRSATDTSLGNATAGVAIAATADSIMKRWVASWGKWVAVSRAQGIQGTRVTFPIAFTPVRGSRVRLAISASGTTRITIESLGIAPATIKGAA